MANKGRRDGAVVINPHIYYRDQRKNTVKAWIETREPKGHPISAWNPEKLWKKWL